MNLNGGRRGALGRLVLSALLAAAGSGSGRAQAGGDEAAQLFSALGLKPGHRVADVGAGDGQWAERMAREVGEAGHVFATEVDEAELEKIRKRVRDASLSNVTAVRGTQDETGLEAGCCDAILVRMVYHHFADPAKMRKSLRAALRPKALLVVIDTEPQAGWRRLEGVPERGGHGIKQDDLVREMTGDGFEVAAAHPDWSGDGDRYCVVFRRARTAG